MFDASNYVLGPYLYCFWSLVLLWALFVAMSRFLMGVSWWRHRLQCIVIVGSFLRLLKLHKLAVGKLDLSRGGLTQCHGMLDHGLNLCRNIPLAWDRHCPLNFCVKMSRCCMDSTPTNFRIRMNFCLIFCHLPIAHRTFFVKWKKS